MHVALDHAVHGAVALQLDELGRHANHAGKIQKRRRRELDVALLEYGFRELQESPVAVDVAPVPASDLSVHALEVPRIVELVTVLPAQPVHRVDRKQLDVVANLTAGQCKQLLEAIGGRDDRGPGVEREALVVPDVRAAAWLVAPLEQDRRDSGRLQADRGREPAEAGTDDGRTPGAVHARCPVDARVPPKQLRTARPTGTGGLPDRIRIRSAMVVRPA